MVNAVSRQLEHTIIRYLFAKFFHEFMVCTKVAQWRAARFRESSASLVSTSAYHRVTENSLVNIVLEEMRD